MWSPDGQWIAWALSEGGQSTVFRRRADGAGPPEALSKLPSPIHTHVEDWMGDGRLLVSNAQTPDSPNAYVALLGLDADRMLTPLLRPSYNVREARASPDGRWIAYSSQESGRYEVYVQPFPSLEGKWQISTDGATEPVWSRKGDELFFRGEGALMAVRVSSAASFSAGGAQKLFDDRYSFVNAGRANYDVSSDGQRFLVVKRDPSDKQVGDNPQVILVQNWLEELKRLVPTD